MGKTTFALRYVNGSQHKRVFVFDPENEFQQRFQIKDEKIARNIPDIYRLAETERITIFDPQIEYEGMNAEAFELFSEVVFALARDGLCPQKIQSLMITDELQKYVNHAYAPQSFRTILETGRRQMLDTLSLSRAPNRLHTGIREEFTELVLFRLDDENSLKFAEGVGADIEQVKTLNEHEFLYFNILRGGERRGQLQFVGKQDVRK
jgi:hypothetical protein